MAMELKTICLFVTVVYIGFLSPTVNASPAQKMYKVEKIQAGQVEVLNEVSFSELSEAHFFSYVLNNRNFDIKIHA